MEKQIRPMRADEVAGLLAMMRPVWHETYDEILPQEQIEYLLTHYFAPEAVAAFQAAGYHYFFMCRDEEPVGLLVYRHDSDAVYLDKLYVSPAARRQGFAHLAFAHLFEMGRDVTLNVNRENKRAIAVYRHEGFIVEREEEIPLSDGMVNYDYRMRRPAGKQAPSSL